MWLQARFSFRNSSAAGKEIKRFYYLDMKKCLDESEDRYDATVPVPEARKIKTDFNRKVLLDLSTRRGLE